MKILKAIGVTLLTLFVGAIVITIPIFVGLHLFEGNTFLKIGGMLATVMLLVLLLGDIRRRILKKGEVVFGHLPWWQILLITAVAFLIIMGVNHVLAKFGIVTTNGNNEDIKRLLRSQDSMWVMMISTHLSGPLLEELLCRGLLMEKLLQYFPKYEWLGLVVSAGVFAFAHTFSLSWSLIDYFISGLVFSYLYYRTRRVGYSFTSHALTNMTITLLSMLFGG
ncbi:CPBP family intramembrane glutamic endopeptidase [Streptococcus caprae]|uniref:CPBP family intramembrane glutamic endopeptidase n=1 Tax=Streptococcus caprae TaxID=1640501 RepID=A0ABV8CU52_9STRE